VVQDLNFKLPKCQMTNVKQQNVKQQNAKLQMVDITNCPNLTLHNPTTRLSSTYNTCDQRLTPVLGR
jgi:hypothetical protein